MSNKTYWNNRDKERFEYIRQNLADDKAFNASLEKYYQRTIDAINKDIQSELQSFAARDGVSLAEARKKVSKADIRQFEAEAKKVVKEADQMRKKGKRVGYSDFSDEVNERMRLYNVTMRINRLEYLKSLIGVRLIELGVDINAELNVKLDEDARKEFERQAGILAGAGMADAMDWWTEENVQKIIMSNTRSANFSTRIWSNIDVLKSELEKQLSRVLISGENPKATAKEFYKHMTKDVGNMRAAAERIARTESARCQTQATLESFKEYDVKYCRWIAEPRACVVCKEIASHSSGNGVGVYPVKDVPELPQHPNCRCALSAYWVDELKNNFLNNIEPSLSLEHSIPFSYNPSSVVLKLADGKPVQYRVYDSLGKPKVDYDLTNHGAPKYHPIVPHAHDWLAIKSDGVVKYKRKKEWRELNQNEKNNIERWLKSHERK
ncbi:minor capsid protein [Ligilactobacillus ruminis]|uniref:minor capsid protein n=1 Tax=Ligilactobacillus ruminis TaxID=1623 RepID=UPI0034A4BDDF